MKENNEDELVTRNEGCSAEDLVESREEEYEGEDLEPSQTPSLLEPKNGEKTAKNGEATQFKNGNPGGPGRPPKPKSLKALIRHWLFAENDSDARRIINVLFDKAIEGDMTAIRLLLEHGKPERYA
jgi:hypothetical protein